jgi:hypothetical protein
MSNDEKKYYYKRKEGKKENVLPEEWIEKVYVKKSINPHTMEIIVCLIVLFLIYLLIDSEKFV